MLAQILHDLHVPRELLDGLPEDQKQLLFCKMREEQVRRYHEQEDEDASFAAATNGNTMKKKKKRKQVTFRLGADGNEWCWVMGESDYGLTSIEEPIQIYEQSDSRMNNENMDVDHQDQLRTIAGATHTHPTRNASYYTVHRDERLDVFLDNTQQTTFDAMRKQIEEISNNIQEARRIFERLETETRRLVLDKESEVLQQRTRPNGSTDLVDELFYREIEERAKKADRERRETARRARDNYQRNSMQLNVCFDTDNHTTILLQPPPLSSSTRANREPTKEKQIQIELVENHPPALSSNDIQQFPVEQEPPSHLTIVEPQRSKPLLPLTREDIRHWFCVSEIPYGSFRSAVNGQIYPWFHGIISRSSTEQLLSSKPLGSYLVRINEKIYGYALSYRASDHCRHLLIEVISSGKRDDNRTKQHAYRFLGGAKHEFFTQLSQLIDKYSNTPIRSNSTDVLRYPCGQIDATKPDYADLFPDEFNAKQDESLYISLETTTSSPQSMTHL